MPDQEHSPEAVGEQCSSQLFAGWLTYGDGDPLTHEFVSTGLERVGPTDDITVASEVTQTIDGEVNG